MTSANPNSPEFGSSKTASRRSRLKHWDVSQGCAARDGQPAKRRSGWVSARTIQSWVERWQQKWLHPQLRGRPAHRTDRPNRQRFLALRDLLGPHASVPTCKPSFPRWPGGNSATSCAAIAWSGSVSTSCSSMRYTGSGPGAFDPSTSPSRHSPSTLATNGCSRSETWPASTSFCGYRSPTKRRRRLWPRCKGCSLPMGRRWC